MATAILAPVHASRVEAAIPSDPVLAAARDGDRTALGEVLELIERRVYVLALRLVCDADAAEDLAQDAMLKICRHIGRYRVGSNFWGWVYRIVVNQAHDIRRATKPTVPDVEDRPVAPNQDPVRSDQLDRVFAAMRSLSDKERTALVLLDIEGYSSKEAGEILDCLPITVRTRAAVARRKVRTRLCRHYPELQEIL